MKTRRKTAAADPLPLTKLPENFFRRDSSELPANYRRPQRRRAPPPRQLKPLELAYWREHQIKIASLHYLNSKRFSRFGGGIPHGTDFAVIGQRGIEHRRTFFLDRLPLPPVQKELSRSLAQAFGQRACACGRELYGCAPPGGGCEGGGGGEGCGGCGCGEGAGNEGGCGCGGAGGCGCGACAEGGCGGCSCSGCGDTCGGCGPCSGPDSGPCAGPCGQDVGATCAQCAPTDAAAANCSPSSGGCICVGSDANCTGGFCGACTSGGGGCTVGAGGSGCVGGFGSLCQIGADIDFGQGVIGTIGQS